jgi:hypothetical protein
VQKYPFNEEEEHDMNKIPPKKIYCQLYSPSVNIVATFSDICSSYNGISCVHYSGNMKGNIRPVLQSWKFKRE